MAVSRHLWYGGPSPGETMAESIAKDRTIGSLTAFCEASSATPAERRMVIWTFFNRLKLNQPSRYGATVAGVCLKRMQYSEWNGDRGNNRNLMRGAETPDDDKTMLDCAAAFDEVLAAQSDLTAVDPTSGATHYWDHTIPPPYWAAQATITITTDNFTFAKDVP